MEASDFDKYLIKSGDNRIVDNNLICNEHGFASYQVTPESVVILQCYGNGKYWNDFFINIARENGLKKITFLTRRNYRAFERKFGYKKVGYVLEREVV